ncbi:hypothetical protein Ae201684_008313 [Aphanomyces euteiches]|uniref:Uncharacterized protein n=1 Tax=Aphanomyces euteiches TaxID=100861 RepID=A0A6G0X590_9STRA|nr:hypothetical protein Ae201684_008313 [Aphanomyces euteiches]
MTSWDRPVACHFAASSFVFSNTNEVRTTFASWRSYSSDATPSSPSLALTWPLPMNFTNTPRGEGLVGGILSQTP